MPTATAQPRLSNGRFAPKTNKQTQPQKNPLAGTWPPDPYAQKPYKQPAPPPVVQQKKTIVNNIMLVVDASSSISDYHLTRKVIETYDNLISSLRVSSAETGQVTNVGVVVFSYPEQTAVAQYPVKVTDARSLGNLGYSPYGNTALYDGVGLAVESLSKLPVNQNDDVSYLVVVLTDGEENSSRRYTSITLKSLLQSKEKEGNWTFTFQLPPGRGDRFASLLGISRDNIVEWEQTDKGLKEAEVKTSGGFEKFYTSRSAGLKSVKNFYEEVAVDLSGVQTKDLKDKLSDVKRNYIQLDVDKEDNIKDFVERKTGQPYVTGSAYYQLTKKEKVQPTKDVLVMEKGKQAIWGGNESRDLIGLPTDGVSHAHVEPYNLATFNVFLKSTSHNRILVRGTKVLIDVSKKKADAPTWQPPTP